MSRPLIIFVIVCSSILMQGCAPETVQGESFSIRRAMVDYRQKVLSNVNPASEHITPFGIDIRHNANSGIWMCRQGGQVIRVECKFRRDGEKFAALLRSYGFGSVHIAPLKKFTFSTNLFSDDMEDDGPLHINSGGLACISNLALNSINAVRFKRDLHIADRQIAPDLCLSDTARLRYRILSGFSPSLSVIGGILGELCCGNSSRQCESSYKTAQSAKQPSRSGCVLGGISRLPLGAKIGSAIIIALFAWFIQVRGFLCLMLRRDDP